MNIDVCEQGTDNLLTALGEVTNHTSQTMDYEFYVTFDNGDGQLITSSKVKSFNGVAPGQSMQFQLYAQVDGTVSGVQCSPQIEASLS